MINNWMLSLKGTALSTTVPFPTKAQGMSWKMRQEECKKQRLARRAMKCLLSSCFNMTVMNSQLLWLPVQDMCMNMSAKIQALTEALLVVGISWGRNSYLFVEHASCDLVR